MENLSVKYLSELNNLELLANQVVEGFITGMHKSPFHGFSVEFAEHRLYNKGESTRDIDWKLYAKTKKLFVKRYEEETNLRCHLIIDNSASMHFPMIKALRKLSIKYGLTEKKLTLPNCLSPAKQQSLKPIYLTAEHSV